jgi:hypothetical protein
MIVGLLLGLPCGGEPDCCAPQTVCRPTPDVIKTTRPAYHCEVRELCLKCLDLRALFGLHDPSVPGCCTTCKAKPRTVRVLFKKIVTEERPGVKCVPEPATTCESPR